MGAALGSLLGMRSALKYLGRFHTMRAISVPGVDWHTLDAEAKKAIDALTRVVLEQNRIDAINAELRITPPGCAEGEPFYTPPEES
jgi:hypothetical protein